MLGLIVVVVLMAGIISVALVQTRSAYTASLGSTLNAGDMHAPQFAGEQFCRLEKFNMCLRFALRVHRLLQLAAVRAGRAGASVCRCFDAITCSSQLHACSQMLCTAGSVLLPPGLLLLRHMGDLITCRVA